MSADRERITAINLIILSKSDKKRCRTRGSVLIRRVYQGKLDHFIATDRTDGVTDTFQHAPGVQ